MLKRILGAAAMATCLMAPAVQASVLYEYTGMQTVDLGPVNPDDPDGDHNTVVVHTAFSLTKASFITNGTFTPDSCTDDNVAFSCGDMEFNNVPNDFNVGGDFLSFGHSYDDGTTAFSGGAFFFFAPGAFGAVGTYTTDGWPINGPPIGPENGYGCCFGNAGFATLKVSGAPDGAAIPEPGAWALMITGFGGAGAALRRRRNRDTYVAA
jgi:hypothetical protein